MALPNELILDICGYLTNPDLKACRSVSKSWSAPASVYLFSKIYISPREEDIEVFNFITQNALLSRCVRTLEYDNTMFALGVCPVMYTEAFRRQVTSYPKLYRACLGNKDAGFTQFIKRCFNEPDSVRKELTGSDFIRKSYREWGDREEYQKRIMMNGEFLGILKRGLGRLELLKSIEVTNGWSTSNLQDLDITEDQTYSYFYGSPFARRRQLSLPSPNGMGSFGLMSDDPPESDWVEVLTTGLVKARNPWSWSTRRPVNHMDVFEVITSALSLSQKRLCSFAMSRLPVAVFDPYLSGVIKNGNISAYSSLEQYALGLHGDNWSSHNEARYLPTIQGLLGSMRGLRILELSAPLDRDRHVRIPSSHRYWKIFPTDGTQWIALAKLKLFGFGVSVKNLCHLLKIRMPNLRELSFREVELLEGRWEVVIEFLKTSMLLLSFPTEGSWQNYHQSGELFPAGLPAERLAMGKEIEKYVVNGGRHPYLRADEDDSASTKYLSDLDLDFNLETDGKSCYSFIVTIGWPG